MAINLGRQFKFNEATHQGEAEAYMVTIMEVCYKWAFCVCFLYEMCLVMVKPLSWDSEQICPRCHKGLYSCKVPSSPCVNRSTSTVTWIALANTPRKSILSRFDLGLYVSNFTLLWVRLYDSSVATYSLPTFNFTIIRTAYIQPVYTHTHTHTHTHTLTYITLIHMYTHTYTYTHQPYITMGAEAPPPPDFRLYIIHYNYIDMAKKSLDLDQNIRLIVA